MYMYMYVTGNSSVLPRIQKWGDIFKIFMFMYGYTSNPTNSSIWIINKQLITCDK